MAKILLVASSAPSLTNFRGQLIDELLARGHHVHAVAPELLSQGGTLGWLEARGVVCHDMWLARTGLSPLADLRTLVGLFRLMRRVRPDICLAYTIKPVIWGGLAAWLARVPGRVALITGLGYVFTGEARGKRAVIRRLVRRLYALALHRATLVFFQNPDDRTDFARWGVLPSNVPVHVVNGSGVDTEAFAPAPLPDGPPRFLMIARLLGDKGIREYVAAAAQLRAHWPEATFHLVGPLDPNPDVISPDGIQGLLDAGHVVWHGGLADVRPAIADAHVFVLPSYREGTPRTVLEAMAMGRPAITTDAPGCRETVQEGISGFLVPVRDADALAAAMARFLRDPGLAARMGPEARRRAVEKYDVHKVNATMCREMGL